MSFSVSVLIGSTNLRTHRPVQCSFFASCRAVAASPDIKLYRCSVGPSLNSPHESLIFSVFQLECPSERMHGRQRCFPLNAIRCFLFILLRNPPSSAMEGQVSFLSFFLPRARQSADRMPVPSFSHQHGMAFVVAKPCITTKYSHARDMPPSYTYVAARLMQSDKVRSWLPGSFFSVRMDQQRRRRASGMIDYFDGAHGLLVVLAGTHQKPEQCGV